MSLEKLFELAEQAIEKTYPNSYNKKPKGYWGDSHIPNYGILKMNIVEVLDSAICESNKWIPIENNPPKDGTIIQLYGRKEILAYDNITYEKEHKVYFGYWYENFTWVCFDVKEHSCKGHILYLRDVTHFKYINKDEPS